MKIKIYQGFIDNKKIFILFASALMYILGGGIAHYLGADYRLLEFWLGLIWIISVHIAGYLLIVYFSPHNRKSEHEEIVMIFKQKKETILQFAMLFILVSCVVIAIFLVNNKISIYSGTLYILTFLGLVGIAIPPLNLSIKGYQEIGLSIFQGCLVPAIGFFLLRETFHKLLFSIAFPMTILALGAYLAWNFSTFAHDQRIDKKTFVRLITWQRAVSAHHILLFSAYIIFFLGYTRGSPIELFRAVLLTSPLAGFQIFWLQKIISGGNPLWPFFNVLSASVYGLSAYLIAFTLWTN